ncbi:tRNA-dihydrouridine synthase 1-like protein [Cavenderia fasciculata]|uniref:tRNA-dihydrouridine(16/17) synthase [NAD(P)(+)] n=1 Tax=Cavenderia fasciculata TaxID=261658 RepID=F4PTC0_CACFS|nr:tRNA-dihydrouridine synthase 1-like protein [Cavenderia fasciculata]EGG21642.1 tRNA-dihydrouridine synthase 1-like protein [Cavenderia fasciculata]|eukprot:XP_004359492.1 tRNA-dihydrouridine synthase 1-like protein [Cavenderia fasciculata]
MSTTNNRQEEEQDTKNEETMNKLATTLIESLHKKLTGHDFIKMVRETTGNHSNPIKVLAPMVEHSLLAFRLLTRKFGADVVYTPMYNSKIFSHDATYRCNFSTNPQDRPMVVQFCGNEVDHIVKSAKMVEDHCDAVDINLGCPQGIARKGFYGAFLLERPDIVLPMVRALHKELKVPIFCKIRLLPDIDDTIKLALQLQEAGCQLLTVHGRTKEQKGEFLCHADWKAIRRVKEAVSIPVFANGSVDEYKDIVPCLEESGADGVMSADGILANPAMFSGLDMTLTDVCREYLDICDQIPTDFFLIRSHCYKMLKRHMDDYEDIRYKISKMIDVTDMRGILDEIDRRVKEKVPKIRMLTNAEKRDLKKQQEEAIGAMAADAALTNKNTNNGADNCYGTCKKEEEEEIYFDLDNLPSDTTTTTTASVNS